MLIASSPALHLRCEQVQVSTPTPLCCGGHGARRAHATRERNAVKSKDARRSAHAVPQPKAGRRAGRDAYGYHATRFGMTGPVWRSTGFRSRANPVSFVQRVLYNRWRTNRVTAGIHDMCVTVGRDSRDRYFNFQPGPHDDD